MKGALTSDALMQGRGGQVVQMWWDVLAELPEADRVRVLRWSTGWPALPAGGWPAGRRFTLRALSIGPDHLRSCRTPLHKTLSFQGALI